MYLNQIRYMPRVINKDYQAKMKWEPKYAEHLLDMAEKQMPRVQKLQNKAAGEQAKNDLKMLKQYGGKWADTMAGQQIDLQRGRGAQYSNLMAQQQLDLERQFGPQFAQAYRQRLQATDPAAFAIREEMGKKIQADLAAGTNLTADERREAEQAVRAAQSARGQTRGNASIFQEALTKGSRGRELYQQRLSNAANFSANITPNQAAVTMPQVQQMSMPQLPNFAGQLPSMNGFGMGGGGGGGGGGLSYYSMPQGISPQQNYENMMSYTEAQTAYGQARNRPNPWLKAGVGVASGALSGALAGSAVPGIGTAIGAGVGALAGGLGSLI